MDSTNKILEKTLEWQKVKLYKIKHFIFDFGGVLVEQSFTDNNLLDVLEHDLGIQIPRDSKSYTKKMNRRMKAGRIASKEYLEKLLEEYYYPHQKKDGALPAKKVNIEYYLELWFEMYTRLTNFSYKMENCIERLHHAGYTVSLLSNTFDIHVKSIELRGFYDIFDHVYLSNELGMIKPDIKKYKYVLKKLDTEGKKCIFIDDKLPNLVPARKLGMVVLKFESVEKFDQQLTQLGIGELSKGLRKQIKNKYENYKETKKKYKKAKKELKKAEKKRTKSLKNRLKYFLKKKTFLKHKEEYEKEKEVVEELEPKIKPS